MFYSISYITLYIESILTIIIECYGIDYFVKEIIITNLFWLLLGFWKNFISFVKELL